MIDAPSRPYVSPVPAEEAPNYRRRIEGNPVIERQHLWPRRDGGVDRCDPRLCRECERERSWVEGQTRGLAPAGTEAEQIP